MQGIGAYRLPGGKQAGRPRWALAAGLLLLVVAAFSACSRTPDEVRVRQAIEQAAEAAEHGHAGDLGDVLDEGFVGNDGELDRQRLLNMLRFAHLRGGDPGVLLGPIDIETRGERLLAHFTVTLSGGGRVLPDHLGVYTVDSAWKQIDGDWRCYSASWKRKL